ncbi:MAG: transcription antitermination factor NusB [Dehalococcoidia bacterium]|nr:transcription antitermination factor NusB [Dehalococcoidia bacterium]
MGMGAMEECEELEQELPTSPRRRARAAALQVICAVDASRCGPQETLAWVAEELALSPQARRFAARLVGGVLEHLEKIDQALLTHAPAFPVHQLALVDRNMLRMAIFEITMDRETPPRAAINEAVELAKLFGGDTSSRFVNGVLGSLLNALAPQAGASGG